MWYESPLFFILFAVFFIAGKLYDSYSSLHFDWYGMREANKLWRDKNGLFDFKKNTIAAGIVLAISCAIGLVSHSFGAGAALLIPGGPGLLLTGIFNFQKKKKNRAKQIEILKQLRDDPNAVPDVGANSLGLGGHMLITVNGQSFFNPFQFLSVPAQADTQATIDAAWSAIVRYAREVPEDQWFKY